MALIGSYYNPFDHMSWAIDMGVIKNGSDSWGNTSVKCWAACLYLSLIKSLVKLFRLRQQIKGLRFVVVFSW